MANLRSKLKDKSERLLVLAADLDNDLYRKTRISGPVIGRVQNLNGATQLALADPQDTDANTMFQAVKIADDLKKEGYNVNVATITGSETEGYTADREISRQLDIVLSTYKIDACIFVTDGKSDERVLPLVSARIRVNSVVPVTMKQAKQLENTYFTMFEKLKEPHYARIVFGIPALLLLLFAISAAVGVGWEAPIGLIGLYLLAKGFGLEELFIESFRGFGFSIDRLSFAFYLSAVIFFIASLFIAYGNYTTEVAITNSPLLIWANVLEGFLLLSPLVLVLYLVGRIIDVRGRKYMFKIFTYGLYIGSSIIMWVLLYSLVAWIIGQIYFSQLLLFSAVAVVVGVGIYYFTNFLRKRAIRARNMRNKLVVNELGALIGKVAGVDIKSGKLRINTSFGNPVTYSVDRVVEVSDRVVIK